MNTKLITALYLLIFFNPYLTIAQNQDLERRVAQTVREYGEIESANVVEIRSPMASTILSVIAEGKTVKQGETLVRLDAAMVREKIEEQSIVVATVKAELTQAQVILDSLKTEFNGKLAITDRAVEVANLGLRRFVAKDGELALRQEEINLEIKLGNGRLSRLQKTADKIKSLNESKQRNDELAEITAAIIEAKAKLALANDKKIFLNKHFQKEELATLQLALSKAQHEKLIGIGTFENQVRVREANMLAAKTALAIQQEKLDQLKKVAFDCNAPSPIDGLVIYPATSAGRAARSSKTEVGAKVINNQLIMKVVDSKNLQIRVSVNQSRIRRIRVGQSAVIRVDAAGDLELKGKVVQISTVPEATLWLTNDVRRYAVIVSLENPPSFLRLGMTGAVEVNAPPLQK
jgi:multidrug resistance efflux pump